MIRTPHYKLFVSSRKQQVIARVSLPKVPLHLVDLEVQSTYFSLNTFRFSRKYQLLVHFPDQVKVDASGAQVVADKSFIVIRIPFKQEKENEDEQQQQQQGMSSVSVKTGSQKSVSQSSLFPDKKAASLVESDHLAKNRKKIEKPDLHRMSSLRQHLLPFYDNIRKICKNPRKMKRILIHVRPICFLYLRGKLSETDLESIFSNCMHCIQTQETNANVFPPKQQETFVRLYPRNENEQEKNKKPGETKKQNEKERMLSLVGEIGKQMADKQQRDAAKEREKAKALETLTSKRMLRRERKRMKRKLAKKMTASHVVYASKLNGISPTQQQRNSRVRFSENL